MGTCSRGSGAPSALEAFKENAKQLGNAMQNARNSNAAELHYTDITGKVVKRYWDGAKFGDRPSSMAQQYSGRRGVYKVQFKAPVSWKRKNS